MCVYFIRQNYIYTAYYEAIKGIKILDYSLEPIKIYIFYDLIHNLLIIEEKNQIANN